MVVHPRIKMKTGHKMVSGLSHSRSLALFRMANNIIVLLCLR